MNRQRIGWWLQGLRGAGVRPGGRAVARGIGRVAACIGLAAAAWLASCATLEATPATITLLHVNDTHSRLEACGPRDRNMEGTLGGMEKAASVIAAVRAAEPNVLLLHAGDVFHGDLLFNRYFGVPELQLMQQLGFDAMAVGNHEFDFGPDVLTGSLLAASVGDTLPLLSANLDLSGYPALGEWIKPYVLKEVGGVRVGIFGMTTPDNPMAAPDPVEILGAGDPAVVLGIAGTAAAELRGAGADVVVCLSHLGLAYDTAIAANVPGIDIIVGGHDHFALQQPIAVANPGGTSTLVVQAGAYYRYVGRLRFAVEGGAVQGIDYALLPVDEKVTPFPPLEAVVDELKQGIEETFGDVYHLVLAKAARDVDATTNPRLPMRDSAMGNLITDALRDATGTDIAMTVDGLIDVGIVRGPIIGADLFRTVSYGYDPNTGLGLRIATFGITGAELVRSLEIALAYLGISGDFFPQVSGMSFRYDTEAAPGARVVPGSVRVQGERLDPARTYSVTANEAFAAFLPMLGIGVSDTVVLPDLEYNVLKAYVVQLGVVHARSEGRIEQIPWARPGAGPKVRD